MTLVRVRVGYLVAVMVALCALPTLVVHAQAAGCHIASQAEVDAGAVAGREVCAADVAAGITVQAGEAKEYLRSIFTSGGQQCTAQQDKIGQLNNTFATCAAQMLKAYQERYGKVTINRAYNAMSCEAALCVNNPGCGGFNNNPAPNSSHVQGVAMDVQTQNQQQLIGFARANPQFGVCFPISWDTVHLVGAGYSNNGESRSCASQGITQPCDGLQAGQVNAPNMSGLPPASQYGMSPNTPAPAGYTTPPASPASVAPIGSPPPLGNNTTAYAVGTCSPQFYCYNNSLTYRASTCVDQTYQTCAYGCSGNQCAPAGSPSSSTSTVANTSPVNTGISLDSLFNFASSTPSQTSSQTVSTSTPVFNSNMADVVALKVANPFASLGQQVATAAPQTAYTSGETFTSSDLSYSPGGSFSSVVQNNSLQFTLGVLKDALVGLLGLLKPFGGVNPHATGTLY